MKLSKCEVSYVAHMGDDLMVVNAARQSFNKQKGEFDPSDAALIDFLASGMTNMEWEAFLDDVMATTDRYLLKSKLRAYKRQAQHWAPFGHPHVTLRLRMPIFLARQFVKHQVGGVWSEESRRYISGDVDFFIEPVVQARPANVKQGAGEALSDTLEAQAREVMLDATLVAQQAYTHLVQDLKVAPEQAREILTLNMMTGVTWTGSLLFWSRVCNQRIDGHAQGAARDLGRQIAAVVAPLFPVSWAALVE